MSKSNVNAVLAVQNSTPIHRWVYPVDRRHIQATIRAMNLSPSYSIAAAMAVMDGLKNYGDSFTVTSGWMYRVMADKDIYGPATGRTDHQSGTSPVPVHHAMAVFAAARLVRMRSRKGLSV